MAPVNLCAVLDMWMWNVHSYRGMIQIPNYTRSHTKTVSKDLIVGKIYCLLVPRMESLMFTFTFLLF